MPKRTNSFQSLVGLIQRALAPQGAVITESAIDKSTGVDREIDVLIEISTGLYRLKIAVEAKDFKRKLDLPAIETLIGKYRVPDGVSINQVVLVTRNGITKTAASRAKQVGFRVFTLSEAENHDWTSIVPSKQRGKLRMFKPPHLAMVFPEPPIAEFDPRVVFEKGVVKCLCCGRDNGTLKQYALHLLQCHLPLDAKSEMDRTLRKLQNDANDGDYCVRLSWSPKNKVITIEDREYPVKSLTAHYHGRRETGEMNMSCWRLVDEAGTPQVVQYASGVVGKQKLELLIPDGKKSKQITLRFSEDCP